MRVQVVAAKERRRTAARQRVNEYGEHREGSDERRCSDYKTTKASFAFTRSVFVGFVARTTTCSTSQLHAMVGRRWEGDPTTLESNPFQECASGPLSYNIGHSFRDSTFQYTSKVSLQHELPRRH